MRKVTVKEIAEQMHLSRNTVSKALNNGEVGTETKLNVLRTAQRMGYSKLTREHRELITGVPEPDEEEGEEIQTILVLFGRSQENFWNHIMAGISDELYPRGYRMLLHIVDEDKQDANEVHRKLTSDIKGLIFLSVFSKSFVRKMAQTGLPMTFFDALPDMDSFLQYGDIIYSESWFSVQHLVQRVIEMGKTEFGFVGYAEGTKSLGDRYGGYLHALQQNGLTAKPKFQFTEKIPGDYYEYAEVEKLIFNMDEYPEVFVCANDAIAKCVASALHKKDPVLEKNMIITGFDHAIEPEFFRQEIYSVDVNKEDVGKHLAKSVLDQVDYHMEHAIISIRTRPDLI